MPVYLASIFDVKSKKIRHLFIFTFTLDGQTARRTDTKERTNSQTDTKQRVATVLSVSDQTTPVSLPFIGLTRIYKI